MRLLQKLEGKLRRFLNRRSLAPWLVYRDVVHPTTFEKAVETGFFKSFVSPVSPNLEELERILVLAPHQDDEAIGCGGLIGLIHDKVEIDIVFLTNGAQTNLGVCEEQSVLLRNQEALDALKPYKTNIHFLGLNNLKLEVSDENISRLRECLKQFKPDLVLTPWLFDRPFKHRICNLITYHALKDLAHYRKIPNWGYQVHNALIPNVVIDISAVIHQKVEMIKQYESQIKQVAPYHHFIEGLNKWNSQYLKTTEEKWAEIFTAFEGEDWIRLVETVILPNQKTYIENN
ncbi:MAG: PIG-L family deacetylase [Crocinitomicaceae bacterium]|jgi:LmbE family N-acetylglucosaminyl deacetylase|nr:PIG-L family deacetylase [Crocinitomicaceae bacterium]